MSLISDGLDGWNKMHSAEGGQHYNNHHFNHHHNHNNHINPSNHHYRQRRHGGNNLHHSSNGFDVYHEWTPTKQRQEFSEQNKRKGEIRKYGTCVISYCN